MSNQAKFYELPPDPVPMNRRVYAAAKAPFKWLWSSISWVGLPFAWALPFAMLLSFGATVWVEAKKGAPLFTAQVASDIVVVGLVWTVYLGVVFLVLKVVGKLLDW